MESGLAHLTGFAAGALGGIAVSGFLGVLPGVGPWGATVLHFGAATLSWGAARMRSSGEKSSMVSLHPQR